MNHRPINTLEEDFAALGLVEMGESEDLEEMNPNQLAAELRKRQLKTGKKDLSPSPIKGKRPGMEDLDLDDEDGLDEAGSMRIRKQRGAGIAAKHHAAKIAYATGGARKAKIARAKPKARQQRAYMKHQSPARAGFRRKSRGEGVDLGNLGGTIQALGEASNTAALQKAFSNIYTYGRNIAEGYKSLIEGDYISRYVSYPVMLESAALMAKESQNFAHALSEHDEFLKVADQSLLQDHAERMVDHLDKLAESLSDAETAIAIDEGTFDPEIHDTELAEMFGVPIENEFDDDLDDDLDEMEQKYGEGPMKPIHGFGNQPDGRVFSVMDPLGIAKVGHREKLVLAAQLKKETAEDEDPDGDIVDEDDTDSSEHFWQL